MLDVISIAKNVINLEAGALDALVQSIDYNFVRVAKLISQCNGRVIFTGMGKSGHIAQKLASTFASTGTPAFFVHPAEASHGDLGMVMKDDIVICLSNSGETEELHDLIAFTEAIEVCLIAITSYIDSRLVKMSQEVILLPHIKEACTHGLAPTTSTTMMLALGDALAVAVMEMKGFSKSDFKRLHPKGLYRKLI